MSTQKPLNILIFGTGGKYIPSVVRQKYQPSTTAVDSTPGWRLAQNPNSNLFVVCQCNYDVIKKQGVRMNTNLWGNGMFKPHRVVRSTDEVSYLKFDYVVCANTITSSDCSSTIKELNHVLSPTTALVSAQNGVGVEAPLGRAFQGNTILSAVCYISCLQPVPGIVQQVSNIRPHAFHIGTYDAPNFGGSVDGR